MKTCVLCFHIILPGVTFTCMWIYAVTTYIPFKKTWFFFMTHSFNTMRKKCRKKYYYIYMQIKVDIRRVRQVRFYVKPQLDKNIWGMTFSYSVRSTSNFCRRSNYTRLNRFFFSIGISTAVVFFTVRRYTFLANSNIGEQLFHVRAQ